MSLVSVGGIDVEGVPPHYGRKSIGTNRGARNGCDISYQTYSISPDARNLAMSSHRLGSTTRHQVTGRHILWACCHLFHCPLQCIIEVSGFLANK